MPSSKLVSWVFSSIRLQPQSQLAQVLQSDGGRQTATPGVEHKMAQFMTVNRMSDMALQNMDTRRHARAASCCLPSPPNYKM